SRRQVRHGLGFPQRSGRRSRGKISLCGGDPHKESSSLCTEGRRSWRQTRDGLRPRRKWWRRLRIRRRGQPLGGRFPPTQDEAWTSSCDHSRGETYRHSRRSRPFPHQRDFRRARPRRNFLYRGGTQRRPARRRRRKGICRASGQANEGPSAPASL
ncbi:uncharacterized protein METZ01_LOCUS323818, partial [marine metagenome]